MAKEKSCGALVWRRRGKDVQMLILRHRMGGHWSFPKGHVERDETEVQTALREVLEETGLHIELADGFREQVSYSPRPGVTKDVVYFLGYAADSRTKRQEEEISEIRWVDVSKIQQFLTYENDRTLIRNATRFMKKRGVIGGEKQTS